MNAVRPAPVLPKQNESPARQSQTPGGRLGDQSPYLQTRRRWLKVLQGMMNAVRPAPVLPKQNGIPSQTKSNPRRSPRRPIHSRVGQPPKRLEPPGDDQRSSSCKTAERGRTRSPLNSTTRRKQPHRRNNHKTFFRSCFISPRRRFDSTKRRLVVLERLALRRRFLESSAKRNWRAAVAADSSLAANKRIASARLRAWDREVVTRTERPVGKWRRVTAVETLLTCWPPGPLDRQKTSSTSFGCHGCIPRPSRQIGLRTSPGVA